MKKISITFLFMFLISGVHLNAMHLVGGEISYTCNGEISEGMYSYNISLIVYRDCTCPIGTPTCADFDDTALARVYDAENNFINLVELNIAGRENIQPNISDLCIEELPNVCVESSIGYEASVTLPFSEGGYTILYQRCCRNATANILNSTATGSTYLVTIPPQNLVACNNSPVFSNFPPIAICAGYPFEFDHAAIDADGDSLIYELCTPFNGASFDMPAVVDTLSEPIYEPIIWEDGFSASNPVLSNPKFTINSTTGQLSGLPTTLGLFTVGVCVKEFRNGNLLNTSSRDFQFNVVDCTVAEFLSSCKRPNKIKAQIFYDLNQNKIKEVEEIWLNDLTIQIDPLGILGFPNYLNEGIFFVSPGTYTVSYNQENNENWLLTTDTASHSFNLAMNETKMVNFGVYPTEKISDVQTIITAPPTRCNESIEINIIAKNSGTTLTDGILWFDGDSLAPALFTDEADTTIAPNTHGWFFTDLYPSQIINKKVDVLIPGPVLIEQEDTSFFQLAESLQFKSRVDYADVNGEHSSDGFEYREIRCSFDPNDKLVHPSRPGNYTLFEEALTYTVRFQNTGNDEAYDILITDTIDSNLDLASMQIISSSHLEKLSTKLSDGRVFTFEFRDINLPDSTSNLKGSQGYVSYKIKPKTGLAENTVIKNSAAIYFDLNPPVQTNTVESKMVSEIPVVSINENNTIQQLAIWPNPTKGLIKIDGLKNNSVYAVFNVIGQPVKSGTIQGKTTIDISEATKGIYFISIEKNGKQTVERIIKL